MLSFPVVAVCLAVLGQEPLWLHEVERVVEPRLEDVGAAGLLEDLTFEASLRDSVLRLTLLVRADRGEAALRALDDLAGAPDEILLDLGRWWIGLERDALARRLLEARPDLRVGWTYVLLDREVERAGMDATLEWVRARERVAPLVWLPHRARLRAERGDAGSLLDEVERDVRAHPEELDRALAFIDMIRQHQPDRSLAWVAEVLRTDGVHADLRLAEALVGCWPEAAVSVLDRADVREPTAADRDWIRMNSPVGLEHSEAETLRRAVRARKLHALRRAGRVDEAQALLGLIVADGGVDPGTGLPAVGLRKAGQIQRASGAHFVEEKVREAETIGEEDPRYWIGRADYFEGREEWDEVRAALVRALALLRDSSASEDEWTHRGAVDRMRRVFRHEGGAPAEAAFLVAELERIAESGRLESAEAWKPTSLTISIVRALAFDLPRELDPEEPVLWSVLAGAPELEHATERLVWRLAERVPGEDRDAFWARCLALPAAAAHASRERLGFAMIVAGEPARAIPFMLRAVDELPDGQHRDRCGFLVVRAGIEAGDWRAARAAWPVGRAHLGLGERPERLLAMAQLAAAEGAADAALELWRRRSNHDAGDLRGLEDLAASGLRERLVEFYRELARRDPACDASARALELLGE